MEPPQNISDIRATLEGLESLCHPNQMSLMQKHRNQDAEPSLETAYAMLYLKTYSGQSVG